MKTKPSETNKSADELKPESVFVETCGFKRLKSDVQEGRGVWTQLGQILGGGV